MKRIIAFLLASVLMISSGCMTMKDHVNYRLLDNINEELKNHRLTVKDAAQIYETINRSREGTGYVAEVF